MFLSQVSLSVTLHVATHETIFDGDFLYQDRHELNVIQDGCYDLDSVIETVSVSFHWIQEQL